MTEGDDARDDGSADGAGCGGGELGAVSESRLPPELADLVGDADAMWERVRAQLRAEGKDPDAVIARAAANLERALANPRPPTDEEIDAAARWICAEESSGCKEGEARVRVHGQEAVSTTREVHTSRGTWRWRVGRRGHVVLLSPSGQRFNVHGHVVKGVDVNTFERGHWKKTTDGTVLPGEVAAYIERGPTVSDDAKKTMSTKAISDMNADELHAYRVYYGLATECRAARDGECSWKGCPQERDGEPAKTGRHCPLDVSVDD